MFYSPHIFIFVMLSFSVKVFATQTDIVLFGDSIINGTNRLAYPLLEQLRESRPISGAGFCSFVNSSGTADSSMVYLRSSLGWTEVDQSNFSIGLNVSHLESDQVGAEINFSIKSDVDEMEIYFLKQPGGGSFRLYDENSGFVTLSTSSPYADTDVYRIRWSPTSLPQTFRLVLHEAGTAGVKIGGVNFKTDGPGIRVHKIGNGGLTAQQAVMVDREQWVETMRELDPEIFCVLLGANDYIRNVSTSLYKANVEELVDRVQEATPDVEVLLMSPPDNAYIDRDHALSEYRDALIELCLERDLRFLDFREALGDYAVADAKGYYSDLVHPSSLGGQMMAEAWFGLVEEVSTDEITLLNLLDQSSVLSSSELKLIGVEEDGVSLSWRKLSGINYTLCKSSNLKDWDEVPIESGQTGRPFTYELDEEVCNFFKLKMDYPGVW